MGLRRFTVHTGGKQRKQETSLRTGCSVVSSGIYRVVHSQHRLPEEVTLIAGQSFPRCSRCADPVYFELVKAAPEIGSGKHGFHVTLYELPEVSPQDESLAG